MSVLGISGINFFLNFHVLRSHFHMFRLCRSINFLNHPVGGKREFSSSYVINLSSPVTTSSASQFCTNILKTLSASLFLVDMLLMVIFSLSLKIWAAIALWFVLAPVAHSYSLGPLYVSFPSLFHAAMISLKFMGFQNFFNYVVNSISLFRAF